MVDESQISHLTRWALEYVHITIEYVPGRKNNIVDALSRSPTGENQQEEEHRKLKWIYRVEIVNKPVENNFSTS